MITMVTCNWQPFQGEDLPKQGFTAEIARQALNRKGHTFKLIFRPWARAVDQAKKGNYVALFNPWKNKDNENDFYFSNEILGKGDGHFLDLPDSKLSNIAPKDLRGKIVGYIRAYPVSSELIQLFESGTVKNHVVSGVTQLIKLLRSGRINLILENYHVAEHNFKISFPGQVFDLKIVGKDLVDGSLYIGWSKILPGTKELRDEFDAAILEMRMDGSIDKIKKEFGIVDFNFPHAK